MSTNLPPCLTKPSTFEALVAL